MPSIMDNFVQIVSYTKDVILLSDYGVKVFLKIHVGVIRFSVTNLHHDWSCSKYETVLITVFPHTREKLRQVVNSLKIGEAGVSPISIVFQIRPHSPKI